MQRNDKGKPLSRSGKCPECGTYIKTLADEIACCKACGWNEIDGKQEDKK